MEVEINCKCLVFKTPPDSRPMTSVERGSSDRAGKLHFFCVAVATEIHQSLVPTQENETIIFEVLQKFKDAGKKVILYISTNYLDGALLKLKIQ